MQLHRLLQLAVDKGASVLHLNYRDLCHVGKVNPARIYLSTYLLAHGENRINEETK